MEFLHDDEFAEHKSEKLIEYFIASHTERFDKGEIWLNGDLTSSVIETVTMKLATLAERAHKRVGLFINSGGGSVDEGFSVIDMIMSMPMEVWTINIGDASSMALSIFLAGNRRFALPHANFMAHSISYSTSKDKLDEQKAWLQYGEIKQKQHAAYYASRTRRSKKWWLEKYNEADYYFGIDEAVKLGIVTDVLDNPKTFCEVFTRAWVDGEES